MPPKEKVSKAKVRQAAFAMTREYGFEEVTARKLAEKIGCSTQPIFRAYENMEDLRRDLFYASVDFFADYIISKKSRTQPVYVTMGMAYIELAVREKNLFKLIATIDDYSSETVQDFVKGEEAQDILDKLPDSGKMSDTRRQELFLCIASFTHGLACLVSSGHVKMPDKDIKALLKISYESLAKGTT